jgi:hypothetical protein
MAAAAWLMLAGMAAAAAAGAGAACGTLRGLGRGAAFVAGGKNRGRAEDAGAVAGAAARRAGGGVGAEAGTGVLVVEARVRVGTVGTMSKPQNCGIPGVEVEVVRKPSVGVAMRGGGGLLGEGGVFSWIH